MVSPVQLQNQARMHRFKSKTELLTAFEKITLSKSRNGRGGQSSKADNKGASSNALGKFYKDRSKIQQKPVRCYNCGKIGHWAKECQQKQREKSVCFNCGEKGHTIQGCVKNIEIKNANTQVNYVNETLSDDEEFKKTVTYESSKLGLEYSVKLETLVVSFMVLIIASYLYRVCNVKVYIQLERMRKENLFIYTYM